MSLPLCPFVPVGMSSSGSCDTGNSAISNQLVARLINRDTHKVNLCHVFSLEGVWSNEVNTEGLSRFGDGKLCWQFAVKALPAFVHLATMTLFECDDRWSLLRFDWQTPGSWTP